MIIVEQGTGLPTAPAVAEKRSDCSFNLLRWFSALSLITILGTGTAMAGFVIWYLENQMLMRDAEVSRAFIESIVATEKSLTYFEAQQSPAMSELLDAFVAHIPTLPDVVRANLYGADRRVIWSTDKRLVGQRFDHNDELERALRDELVVTAGNVAGNEDKPEHVGLNERAQGGLRDRFVEAYLPIRDSAGTKVVAVIEIYKLPETLFHEIDNGIRLVWTSAATGGFILYGSLFWIVRRADRIMRDQRERLIEAETLSAIGEMAAGVAHNIRNPLASIRSAAELAEEEQDDDLRRCLRDIINQTERLDGWVRELLAASRGDLLAVEPLDLNAMLRESLDGVAAELDRRGIRLTLDTASLPPIRGTRVPLGHAIRSIVCNAIEAMPRGGVLSAMSRRMVPGQVQIIIEDNGSGMTPEASKQAFKPLFTTKPNGIGLGLSLSRRIVDRHAGTIELDSVEGRGTRVVLTLPENA